MRTFKRKPDTITGIQWTGNNADEVLQFISPSGKGAAEVDQNNILRVVVGKRTNADKIFLGDFVYREANDPEDYFRTNAAEYMHNWYDEVGSKDCPGPDLSKTYETFRELLNELLKCNDAQLDQPLKALVDDEDGSRTTIGMHISEEAVYSDHAGFAGTLDEVKEAYPDDWEQMIAEAHITPPGTIFLWIDWEKRENARVENARKKSE